MKKNDVKFGIRKEFVTESKESYLGKLKHNPKLKEIYVVFSNETYFSHDYKFTWYLFEKTIPVERPYEVEHATFDKLKDAKDYIKKMSEHNIIEEEV